jgi:hypothetical protein
VITEFVSGRELDRAMPEIAMHAPHALMVMPCIDRAMSLRCAGLMASRAGADGMVLCVHDDVGDGFIAIVNRIFRMTNSSYFGYVAQDAYPGRQWLAVALGALHATGKDLFAFNDGKWMGALASFGIARRDWASRNYGGDFFYPGYVSHYADVELSVMAMNQQSYCYDANSVLLEVDWEKEKSGVNPADRKLFRERRAAKFGDKVHAPALLEMFS